MIVVNKVDLLKDESERDEVRDFVRGVRAMSSKAKRENVNCITRSRNITRILQVRDAARETLGENVSDYMVSSLQEHPQKFDEFEQLQEFVQNTMSEESATMIKLQSICGVGLKVVETHLKSCERRAEMIEEDVKTLNLLEDQNENWKNQVLKDLEGQLQTVDSSLRDVVDRADEFFEDEFQITNIVSLLSGQKDGLERKFEAQVLGDSLRLVDDRTNNLVDWLMRKRSNQMRYV